MLKGHLKGERNFGRVTALILKPAVQWKMVEIQFVIYCSFYDRY